MIDSYKRIKALIIKEFQQIVRDPSSILISFLLPLVLMFFYGFGVSLDLNHLRIGLVLEDTSPTAQSFAATLTNSRYFDVKIARDRREMEEAILSGDIARVCCGACLFLCFSQQSRPDWSHPSHCGWQ